MSNWIVNLSRVISEQLSLTNRGFGLKEAEPKYPEGYKCLVWWWKGTKEEAVNATLQIQCVNVNRVCCVIYCSSLVWTGFYLVFCLIFTVLLPATTLSCLELFLNRRFVWKSFER